MHDQSHDTTFQESWSNAIKNFMEARKGNVGQKDSEI